LRPPRGPVAYCFEPVDQPIPAVAPSATGIKAEPRSGPLGDVWVLKSGAATAIPYFAWNNRGLAPMTVWLPQR